MTPADLPLRDIHLPPEVGFWPPALGWWLLFVVLLALAYALFYYLSRPKVTSLSVLHPALHELERIRHAYQDDSHALLCELSVLLRRVAISVYGRSGVAGLTGDAWTHFLNQKGSTLSPQAQQLLKDGPYQARSEQSVDTEALLEEVRQWLLSQQPQSAATKTHQQELKHV